MKSVSGLRIEVSDQITQKPLFAPPESQNAHL